MTSMPRQSSLPPGCRKGSLPTRRTTKSLGRWPSGPFTGDNIDIGLMVERGVEGKEITSRPVTVGEEIEPIGRGCDTATRMIASFIYVQHDVWASQTERGAAVRSSSDVYKIRKEVTALPEQVMVRTSGAGATPDHRSNILEASWVYCNIATAIIGCNADSRVECSGSADRTLMGMLPSLPGVQEEPHSIVLHDRRSARFFMSGI